MKDKFGIFFASLCLCHCLLTPVLILFVGSNMFLGHLEAEWVHKTLLLPVLAIALSSLSRGWLASRNQWLLILTSAGFTTIISAQFNHGLHELGLTVLGSICFIGAHFLSLTLARHRASS